jgi:predicted transcriptional regulator
MNGIDCCALDDTLTQESPVRRQFVLDKHTDQLIEELASYRAGNRSLVIREAVQVYADIEERLDELEARAGFQQMMAKSDADIEAGRVIPHEEVLKMVRRKKAKKKKR